MRCASYNSDLDNESKDSDIDRTWQPQKVQIIDTYNFTDSYEEVVHLD